MTTATTAVHGRILDALNTAGTLHAQPGPAHDLPVDAAGRVLQAAVLWPSPGRPQYTRAAGASSGRVDTVRITCVGATANDAIAAADKVEAAIGGRRFADRGGPLTFAYASDPETEPGADPTRVSLLVEYTATTKG